jgi:hypothetical protein
MQKFSGCYLNIVTEIIDRKNTPEVCSELHNMFSNINCPCSLDKLHIHFPDIMQFAVFSKIEILKSKIENFKAGGIILNNFYF